MRELHSSWQLETLPGVGGEGGGGGGREGGGGYIVGRVWGLLRSWQLESANRRGGGGRGGTDPQLAAVEALPGAGGVKDTDTVK